MFMDDLKLFEKKKMKKNRNFNTRRIYSQDLGMEFGIEKCTMLVMKSSKRHMTVAMELPNQDKILMLGEKETQKYL